MRSCATNLNSEMTDPEINSLLEVLKSHNLSKTHLEIGTAAGGTLCSILDLYTSNTTANNSPPFIVVDPLTYFPDQLNIVLKNLKNHNLENYDIQFIQKKSNAALKAFSKNPIPLDFILIDGSHKMKHVMHDFKWASFLTCGGILAIHDYSEKFQGVFRSTKRFLSRNTNYELVSRTGSLLILQKKQQSKKEEVSVFDIISATINGLFLQLIASCKKRVS